MTDESAPTATVDVRMLTSMAGAAFSYAPGDIVAVSSEVADAWKAAGIADDPPHADRIEGRLKETSALLADAAREREQLRASLDQALAANHAGAKTLAETNRALEVAVAERDRAVAAASAARAAIVDLTARLAAAEAERDQARADYRDERNARLAGVAVDPGEGETAKTAKK